MSRCRRCFLVLCMLVLCTTACSGVLNAAPTATAPASKTPQPTATPTATITPIQPQRYGRPGDYIDSIQVGQYERPFLLHVPPSYDPAIPMPLVLNLHGRGGTAFMQEDVSGMREKADEEGFLVLTPQALGEPATWYGVFREEIGDQDRAFFPALIAHVQGEVSVDDTRIYATGLSNGANMVNWLACDMSDVFAAIAPVAGAHTAYWECEITEPISILAMHGVNDAIIPYEGSGKDVPAVRTWVEAWVERNGCVLEAETEKPYDGVQLEAWRDCDGGVEVQFYSVERGEHTWIPLVFGSLEQGYAVKVGATDVIWAFFQDHPKVDR